MIMRMIMKIMRMKMSMTILSSTGIEGIRTVFALHFFMKDILNVKNTNKGTSSNFYLYNIHKKAPKQLSSRQYVLKNFYLFNTPKSKQVLYVTQVLHMLRLKKMHKDS